MVRSTIFWIHLVCGVATGLVVLMMSVTGVILTYERQMLAWADRATYPAPTPNAQRLTLEELVEAAKLRRPEFTPTTIVVRNEPDAAVVLGAGRSGSLIVDPYSGDVREPGAQGTANLLLGRDGLAPLVQRDRREPRDGQGDHGRQQPRVPVPRLERHLSVAAARLEMGGVQGAPAVQSEGHDGQSPRLQLAPRVRHLVGDSAGRRRGDGNGLLVPVGQRPRVPRGRRAAAARKAVAAVAAARPAARAGQAEAAVVAPNGTAIDRLGYDALVARAAAHGEWRTLTLNIPADAEAPTVRIGIDQGNGGQPYLRHNLTLDASTGAVESWAPFSSQTTGQKARSWIRFLHTGEALGLVGQTIAGLVSLTSILMVWTGLALAWRRLVQPLFRRQPRYDEPRSCLTASP